MMNVARIARVLVLRKQSVYRHGSKGSAFDAKLFATDILILKKSLAK